MPDVSLTAIAIRALQLPVGRRVHLGEAATAQQRPQLEMLAEPPLHPCALLGLVDQIG